MNLNLPLSLLSQTYGDKSVQLKIPNLLIFFGGLQTSLFFWRSFRNICSNVWTYLKSFFNAKKYLYPFSDRFPMLSAGQRKSFKNGSQNKQEGGNQQSYAVIYGAGNKAGRAFSYYLMEKGFNLILIERDGDTLQKLITELRKKLKDLNPEIVPCILANFDQQSLKYAVGKYATQPVKIFVNCKSSKKSNDKQLHEVKDQEEIERRQRAVLTESTMTTDPKVKEILIKDENDIQNFESMTKAEIAFCGKENIEGYASLVNMWLRSMTKNSINPCIVNVDNVPADLYSLDLKDGQMFYSATLQFKDAFTILLRKVNNMKSINVKTDFKKMPKGTIDHAAAHKLCNMTFAYMGLKDTIYV